MEEGVFSSASTPLMPFFLLSLRVGFLSLSLFWLFWLGCTEEESTRHWVASLTNMTLNKVILPAGESVYQDAKGQPMPPQRWPTEFHYVDGGLDQADTTDFVCVNRIIAEPWRQCFAVPPVDIEESDSEEPLTEEE